MKRFVVIAACGLGLSACSSMPSWMQFDMPKGAPSASTMQFESEPAGAEARTSNGQSCQTPCSLAVSADQFTVTFSLPGYAPQTVPVRLVASTETSPEGETAAPRLVPNPVFVELSPAGAPPPRRTGPVASAKPKPKHRPKPVTTSQAPRNTTSQAPKTSAPQAMAPSPPPPEAAPASPWPPAPAR
jgi:hypothetical protein